MSDAGLVANRIECVGDGSHRAQHLPHIVRAMRSCGKRWMFVPDRAEEIADRGIGAKQYPCAATYFAKIPMHRGVNSIDRARGIAVRDEELGVVQGAPDNCASNGERRRIHGSRLFTSAKRRRARRATWFARKCPRVSSTGTCWSTATTTARAAPPRSAACAAATGTNRRSHEAPPVTRYTQFEYACAIAIVVSTALLIAQRPIGAVS